MGTYQICKKTVMDTSDPYISFDKDGISNHYWKFQEVHKSNWYLDDIGHQYLTKIIEKIKSTGRNNQFDCILGLSGGADSSYLLHKVVTEYGLRPLVFHVDGGWNSEIAVSNINCMIDSLRLELYTEVINWNEMRDFQLAMFKSGVPHIDIPQDMAFIGGIYKFAEQHGIKYILNGANIATESVLMPINIYYWGTDMTHIRDILKRFGSIEMKTYPFSDILYHKFYLRYIKKIRVIKPLNFLNYQKTSAMSELQEKYGWKPYPQKHFESRFTRFLEGYWLPTRFGFDMRRVQYSSLILSGQMERDDALIKLQRPPYEQETITQDFAYIASKLNISVGYLRSMHKQPKKYYWDYKNNKHLFDLGEKVLSVFEKTRRGGAY